MIAAMAMPGKLATRHGDERPARSIDDLQVSHDEAVVDRDRTKGTVIENINIVMPITVLVVEVMYKIKKSSGNLRRS